MVKCAVPSCKNDSRKQTKKDEGISFHRFPKSRELTNKWVTAIKRPNWEPNIWSFVCSMHFSASSIAQSKGGLRKLVGGAIPELKLEVNASGGEPSSSCSEPSSKKKKIDDDSESDEDDSDIEDKYDTWAKECALELRQMAPDQEIFAKAAIRLILMEGRMGRLHKHSIQINKIPEQTMQEDATVSLLDEFLVIRKEPLNVGPSSVAEGPIAPRASSQSPVDPGTSSVTASHKTLKRVRSKPSDKTSKTSHKTATSSLPSSIDNTGSSLVIGSHNTSTSVGTSLPQGKTDSLDNVGSSSAVSYEVTATLDASSSLIVVKAEPLDDAASTTLPVSFESEDPIRSPPSSVKPEPDSPPSSPDFTVVVKEEPE